MIVYSFSYTETHEESHAFAYFASPELHVSGRSVLKYIHRWTLPAAHLPIAPYFVLGSEVGEFHVGPQVFCVSGGNVTLSMIRHQLNICNLVPSSSRFISVCASIDSIGCIYIYLYETLNLRYLCIYIYIIDFMYIYIYIWSLWICF